MADLKLQQLNLLATELNEQRLKQQFNDVILIDQDRNQYPANKNVLAASSAYFYTKFTQPKQCADDGNCVDKLDLPIGVSSKSLQVMLRFSYSGILDVSDDDTEFIRDLLNSSELLQFELIEQYCSQFIFAELTPENFPVHWQYAEKCNDEAKKQEIVKMMAENLIKIHQLNSFLESNVDCIKLMLEQDDLKTQSQDIIFEAILKWVNKDVDGRLCHLDALLGKIIWENVSDDFLESLDETESELIGLSKDLMIRTLKHALKEVSRRLKNPTCRQKQVTEETKQETLVPTPGMNINAASFSVSQVKPIRDQSTSQLPQINSSLNEMKTLASKVDVGLPNNSNSNVNFIPVQNQTPLLVFYEQQHVPYHSRNGIQGPKIGLECFDKRNPKTFNKKERYQPRTTQSTTKPKSDNVPSDKSQTSANKVFALLPVKNDNRRASDTCSENGGYRNQREVHVPRNKSDSFQPNRNYKQHEFDSSRNKSDNFYPNKNRIQRQGTSPSNKSDFPPKRNPNHNQRQAQTPRNKSNDFQPTKNQTPGVKSNPFQPSTNSNQQENDKIQAEKPIIQPVEARKPEIQPTEAGKPEIQPTEAGKPEIQPTEARKPGFQPVEAKKPEIKNTKKADNRFEYFKAKVEPVQSIFNGNEGNQPNPTSAEIVIMRILDENTEVIIIDADGNNAANEVTEIKLPRDAAICSLKNQIHLLGGRNDSGDVFSTYLVFDLDARNWEMLTDMNFCRHSAGATALNDSVYVVGGRGEENQSLCLVECYNSSTKEWSDVAPMKIPRVKPAVCSIGDKVYVCGGDMVSSNSKTSATLGLFATCEMYNVKSKQWVCLQTKLPIQRTLRAFATTVMKGKMYAVTALRNEEKWLLYQYDPRINLWQEIVVRDDKMQAWVSIGTLRDEEFCFVDDAGGIFKYKFRNQPIKVGNSISGDKNVIYAVVL